MKNFDMKLLKKSAKSLLKRNRKCVNYMALTALLISIALELTARLLGVAGGSLSTVFILIGLVLQAPAHIGRLNAYYKMSKGEKADLDGFFSWYKEKGKLFDSIKTEGYYFGILTMWFVIYVLFPMGVVYMIWGKQLMANDAFMNIAIVAVLFTGIMLVAGLPYFIHMLRYSGGLFYAGEETHLNIRMRFDIGEDHIKPHVYRYALLAVSLLPHMALSYLPVILAFMFADKLGIFVYPITLLSNAFSLFVYMPYFEMASVLMFERMKNPKKELKYDIK